MTLRLFEEIFLGCFVAYVVWRRRRDVQSQATLLSPSEKYLNAALVGCALAFWMLASRRIAYIVGWNAAATPLYWFAAAFGLIGVSSLAIFLARTRPKD